MLVTQLCPNLWDSVDCSTPGSSVLHYLPADRSLLKLMSIELVMLSKHLILCRPLLLPPSIFPSVRVFSRKSALCIRWPKYWSFSFSINPSSEYSGLISFRAKVPAAFFSLDFAKNFLHLQQCYKEILLFPPMWGLWKWRQILCLFQDLGGGSGSVAKLCLILCDPWTVTRQAPLSMGFSRQKYWSGLPFSSSGDLSDPGIEPSSPALQEDSLSTEPPGKPRILMLVNKW